MWWESLRYKDMLELSKVKLQSIQSPSTLVWILILSFLMSWTILSTRFNNPFLSSNSIFEISLRVIFRINLRITLNYLSVSLSKVKEILLDNASVSCKISKWIYFSYSISSSISQHEEVYFSMLQSSCFYLIIYSSLLLLSLFCFLCLRKKTVNSSLFFRGSSTISKHKMNKFEMNYSD